MELIDKQKLAIKEIERVVSSNEFWALGSGEHLNMIDTLIDFVHSAQEEIAKLKEEREAYKTSKEAYRICWEAEKARAIQAEQEREVLLVGLKQIARPLPSSYAEMAPVTFARSIIAKIEGSEPK